MENLKAGKPTVDFVKLCYAANMPPMLCGHHGVGKSELLRQAATELGINFISRDLSLMEPPDLIGLPKMSGKSTTYLPPDFLPTGGKGLIVFEELNRCERYMRAPCLQLLTDRALNDYRLPPGWLPAAAINPADEDYEVFDLDPAIRSRFAEAMVIPDPDEWIEWARRDGVHPAVVQYVESDSSIFDIPQSNPRAWKYVSNIISAAEASRASPKSVQAAVVGLVGPARGSAFLRSMKATGRVLSGTDVLGSYHRHRSLVRSWICEGKLDLLEATILALKKHLQPLADYKAAKADRKRWANLTLFVTDLPGDMRESVQEFFEQRKYDFPWEAGKATA